jgi:hypothetical protein
VSKRRSYHWAVIDHEPMHRKQSIGATGTLAAAKAAVEGVLDDYPVSPSRLDITITAEHKLWRLMQATRTKKLVWAREH